MVSNVREAEHRYRLLLLDYYRAYGVVDDEEIDTQVQKAFFDGIVRVLDLTSAEIKHAVEWVLDQIEVQKRIVHQPAVIVPQVKLAVSPKQIQIDKAIEMTCTGDWQAFDGFGAKPEHQPKLLSALQFINQNPNLPIRSLYSLVGLPQAELHRIFCEVLRMHPTRFRQTYRIELIKRSIMEGRTTKEICLICGFKTPMTLYAFFKKATGMTIGTWKNEWLSQKAVILPASVPSA